MRLNSATRGSGPDLFLLHGWGMNAAVWSDLVERLHGSYRVTWAELPGHGDSPYRPELSGLDAWVEACLSAAPPRAVWIGWSLGGQLALQAALSQPQRVERLVIFASTPRFSQDRDWPHAMPEETLRLFAKALLKDHRQTLERFLSLQVQGDEEARRILRRLRQDLSLRGTPDPRALEEGLELLLGVDLREALPGLDCPSLWLLGQRDTLVPAAVRGEISTLLPEADITVLKGSAHAPFLSHPERCLPLLEAFLEECHV